MHAQPSHTNPRYPHLRVVHSSASNRATTLEELSQHLAEQVAAAAGADQFAIMVNGVPNQGGADLEELVPRAWLEYLNSQRPAVYRMSVPLRIGHRELGLVRLGTIDPEGFHPAQIARARSTANAAAETLARRLDQELGRPSFSPRSDRTAVVVQLDDYRPRRRLQNV